MKYQGFIYSKIYKYKKNKQKNNRMSFGAVMIGALRV